MSTFTGKLSIHVYKNTQMKTLMYMPIKKLKKKTCQGDGFAFQCLVPP